MSPARTAVCIGGAVVLAAWLASAASKSARPIEPQASPRRAALAGTERLAADVQAQSARLRHRIASAPVPQQPTRNPFAFAAREAPPDRHVRIAAALPPSAPSIPPDPLLALVGVAEQQTSGGVVRTAIVVGAGDEIFMVTQGDALAGRYSVAAVGPDVVELKDSVTGSIRRLALR